ncbi:MAG: hypothetical protein JWM74_2520 [Myxococcaceae bacterium]|nr:hypothetical protein [Myxococcaceae bacterium]
MDLELAVLGGGTIPTLDFMLPFSVIVPLGNRDLWTGPYIRVGPQFGYSATLGVPSDGFFRLGGHLGFGWDVDLSSSLALRLLDVRFYAEGRGDKTPIDTDRLGNRFDLGFWVATGLTFK